MNLTRRQLNRLATATHGPAKKNLGRLAIAMNSKQHVLVNTGMEIASTQP